MYDDERGHNGRDDRGQFGRFSPRGPRFGGGREHHGGGRGFGGGFGPGFGPGGFGPGFAPGFGFGREGRRARRGDVRLAILSLLGDGPANGYSLIKAINERTDGAWKPSPGSVYPTLQQLVDEGLISASGDAGKSVYELTDAGRAEVEAQADEIARAWQTPTDITDSQREFFESLRKLLGTVHMLRSSGTDAQRAAATEKIDALRRELLLLLAD
jgi:DNA-binding PadR family transcriptional regulator